MSTYLDKIQGIAVRNNIAKLKMPSRPLVIETGIYNIYFL